MSPLAQARLADVRAKKYQPTLDKPGGLPFDSQRYQEKILRMFGGSIVAYWPLDDVSGTIAREVGGNHRNGVYSGATLGQLGIGDGGNGGPSVLFDGVNDYCNVYSTGLVSAFSGQAGSMFTWIRIGVSGVWMDATVRVAMSIFKDNSNFIDILRLGTNGVLDARYRANGGTTKTVAIPTASLDWILVGLTWSLADGQVKIYYNGLQIGATLALSDTWTNSTLDTQRCVLGGYTVPQYPWSGRIAHAMVYDRVLRVAEIAEAYRV